MIARRALPGRPACSPASGSERRQPLFLLHQRCGFPRSSSTRTPPAAGSRLRFQFRCRQRRVPQTQATTDAVRHSIPALREVNQVARHLEPGIGLDLAQQLRAEGRRPHVGRRDTQPFFGPRILSSSALPSRSIRSASLRENSSSVSEPSGKGSGARSAAVEIGEPVDFRAGERFERESEFIGSFLPCPPRPRQPDCPSHAAPAGGNSAIRRRPPGGSANPSIGRPVASN